MIGENAFFMFWNVIRNVIAQNGWLPSRSVPIFEFRVFAVSATGEFHFLAFSNDLDFFLFIRSPEFYNSPFRDDNLLLRTPHPC